MNYLKRALIFLNYTSHSYWSIVLLRTPSTVHEAQINKPQEHFLTWRHTQAWRFISLIAYLCWVCKINLSMITSITYLLCVFCVMKGCICMTSVRPIFFCFKFSKIGVWSCACWLIWPCFLCQITLDSSGTYAATSCSDKSVCITEFDTGECVASMSGHSGRC